MLIYPLLFYELCKIFSNCWTCLEVNDCITYLLSALFVCSSSRFLEELCWVSIWFTLFYMSISSKMENCAWNNTHLHCGSSYDNSCIGSRSSLIVLFLAFSIYYFDCFPPWLPLNFHSWLLTLLTKGLDSTNSGLDSTNSPPINWRSYCYTREKIPLILDRGSMSNICVDIPIKTLQKRHHMFRISLIDNDSDKIATSSNFTSTRWYKSE